MRSLIMLGIVILCAACGKDRSSEEIKNNILVLVTVKNETTDISTRETIDIAIEENNKELAEIEGTEEHRKVKKYHEAIKGEGNGL